MITPADIKTSALRSYAKYLSSLVTGEVFFPLDIRFGKRRPKGDFHDFDRQRATLLRASKGEQRRGFSVEFEPQQTRRYGLQMLPARIYFETDEDYLHSIGKTEEATHFRALCDTTSAVLPDLLPWVAQRPLDVLPFYSVWPDLLLVCSYFRENPRPGCYIRELPLEIHTKFIEEHAGILRKMLEFLLPEDAYDTSQSRFATRFGLKDVEPLVRIRCLSAEAKSKLNFSLEDTGVPLSFAHDLDFKELSVVIVENLMTYLTLPTFCGDAVIFGKGFQVGALKDIESLGDARILYWGDLDAQGFMILSQLRAAFPHTESVFMDISTFEDHRVFAVSGTESNIEDLPGISETEHAVFRLLQSHQLRLEQERIPLRYVRDHWPVH